MALMLLPGCNQVKWPLGRDEASGRQPQRLFCGIADSVTTNEYDLQKKRQHFFLRIGSKAVPHPEKVEKGGEDAFFVSDFDGGVLCIADGVSGWAEANVDPALFSKEFVKHLEEAVNQEESRGDPKALLAKAHSLTECTGAATAIVATLLGEEGVLRVANVGDCGLRIVREGKVVFATAPQQHYFDCPYQFSSEIEGQTAEDAALHEIEVEEGDTVVMGSDGLFDNVFDQDIAATVRFSRGSDQEYANETAAALAWLANKNSRDPKYESPYSNEAISQGFDVPVWRKILGQKLTGGKLDDITVLVGVVNRSQIATPSEDVFLERDEEVKATLS